MENQTEYKPLIDPSSATVQEMFAELLFAHIQNGAVEKAICKNIDNLISRAADDVFGRHSEAGKAINEAMTKAIIPQLEKIGDLPVYHDFVVNRMKLAAQNFYEERLGEALDKELEEVFTELPEEITLSWLVQKMVNEAKRDNYREGDQVTLIMEQPSWSSGGDTVMVYMDKSEDQKSYDCEFELHLSKDSDSGKYEILGIKVGGRKPGERLSIGRIYGYEKVLFNIFAMKGKIDLDKGQDHFDYDTLYERECHCD